MILQVLEALLLLNGSLFIFISCLGVMRLPDTLCRAHALTKALTLGICSLLLAAWLGMVGGEGFWRIPLAIFFQLVTIPISGHLLAFVVRRKGLPLSSLRK